MTLETAGTLGNTLRMAGLDSFPKVSLEACAHNHPDSPVVYTTKVPRKPGAASKRADVVNSPVLQIQTSPSALTLPTPSDADAQSVLSAIRRDSVYTDTPSETTQASTTSPYPSAPTPLNPGSPTQRIASVPAGFGNQIKTAVMSPQRSLSLMMEGKRAHGPESPVMNETLSVIDEHITDLNTPRSSLLAPDNRKVTDSGSDYSNHIDRRLSYINGDETDEDERNAHSEEAVVRWTPNQVAAHLRELGVESGHCDVFREQEISGEVLLGMDQASVFMKELDLGLVGRRLRTWHKIKAFQEEVQSHKASSIRSNLLFGADGGSDDFDQSASQSSTSASVLPRIPSLREHSSPLSSPRRARHERHDSPLALPQIPQGRQDSPILGSSQGRQDNLILESHPELRAESQTLNTEPAVAPFSMTTRAPDSPSRPSAASIRELNHSRRHSSMDHKYDTTMSGSRPSPSHQKSPSFDRNWTMGNRSPALSGRSVSAIGLTALGMTGHALSPSFGRGSVNTSTTELNMESEALRDLDRGYMSGGEVEGKKFRNVLKKREASSVNHSRQSSYTQEKSNSLAVRGKRHSRFGSAGSMSSIRDTISSITSPNLKLGSRDGSRARSSTLGVKTVETFHELPREDASPIVTKLEYPELAATNAKPTTKYNSNSPASSPWTFGQARGTSVNPRPEISIRTDTDNLTANSTEVPQTASSSTTPFGKDASVLASSGAASVTASTASRSIDIESPVASLKKPNTAALPPTELPARNRPKNKKKTSAYTRGLQKLSPQEQMVDCDYSGWMKKKSPSLLTTWKSRLFILRGRRLSYYYSENDTEEKGLIDISSHRVLPADNELVAGLHATFTGAKSSPSSPPGAHTTTLNARESAAQPDSAHHHSGLDNMFIFKLVPPRAGLSRAVNFTKPTIHYFAVDNVKQGRLWMAALMKATIERDESKGVSTTYQQKTISLAKARAMKHRPPALMGPDVISDKSSSAGTGDGEEYSGIGSLPEPPHSGLNIHGLKISYDYILAEANKGLAKGSSISAPPTSLNTSPGFQSASRPDMTPSVDSLIAHTPSTAFASPNLPPEARDVNMTPVATSPAMPSHGSISLVTSPVQDSTMPRHDSQHQATDGEEGAGGSTIVAGLMGTGRPQPEEDASHGEVGSSQVGGREMLFAAMNTVDESSLAHAHIRGDWDEFGMVTK